MKIRTLIIGLGKIGLEYGLEKSSFYLSHSKSFSKHQNFDLVGGVDTDIIKKNKFEKLFLKKSFSDIDIAILSTKSELIVISLPTNLHCNTIRKILKHKTVKYILCEKPFCENYKIGKEILTLCHKKNVNLFINYMRISQPYFNKLKVGHLKNVKKAFVWYSGSLYNSASHFINFLQNIIGNVLDIKVFDAIINSKNEICSDFLLKFEECNIIFMNINAKDYSHNSMEFLTDNHRVRYDFGGQKIVINKSIKDKVFKNYRNLDSTSKTLEAFSSTLQYNVVIELDKFIRGKKSNLVDAKDALKTVKVLNKIEKKSKSLVM